MDFVITLVISLTVLLFSAILHEIAHGLVADRLGDPTARLMGRLTLDPRKHIDPIMSLALPLLLLFSGSHIIFGGAKPVPVDPFNLKEGKKDMALVSLAGPATNILLAVAGALLLHGLTFVPIQPSLIYVYTTLQYILQIIVQINLYLAIFNLLPLPPLDGSKVFAMLLPDREAAAYMSIGMVGIVILFFLLSFPIGGFYLPNFINQIYQIALSLLGL
ncbi:MAG TPA: site-2 protease family protein [Patescibacteria group bacterium]